MKLHTKSALKKDRERKRLQKLKDKTKPKAKQEAHKAAERVKIRNFRLKKKAAQQMLPTVPSSSPFQTKQSAGKALQRTAKSLPNSPRKKVFVLAKMAKEAGLDVKGLKRVRTGLSDECTEAVKSFYESDNISWQAPGRKDRAITREVSINGETSKQATVQVRYLLMSLKEAYHGFIYSFPTMSIGLTKFCELRPPNVKLFD